MQSRALKPVLLVKLSILIVLLTLSPALLILGFLSTQSSVPGNLTLLVILSSAIFCAIGIFWVWFFLKPLRTLYQGILLLQKGEYGHRINIYSADELQSLGELVNQMAGSLGSSIQKVQSGKDILASEKNKLDVIISSIADGVVVLNIHKQVVLSNKAAEGITGYTQEDMKGKRIDQLITLADQSGQKIPAENYCPIDLKNTSYPAPSTFSLSGKNNQKKDIRLSASPIKGEPSADLGCILTFHDVSHEKAFQEMQIDFVSMASHELRTPLTSITGYISTVLQENSNLPQEQKDFLSRALTSAKQLYALVDNILNVSKVERGAFSVNRQPLDWRETLMQIVENNKAQAVQKNINLSLSISDIGLPKVMADPLRISEVLNNLISNALKFTKDGGTIRIAAILQGGEILTSVSDNGFGIPQNAIPHLFAKFYRAPGSLDQMQQGTGLGLYISKSIIDLHRGKIWVESELGKGSTFYFTLPTVLPLQAQPTIAQLHAPMFHSL